jgi:transcriptional regulator of arginine metabolism
MTGTERRERQRILYEAIEAGKIGSQQDVVRYLAKAGIKVTQATASRDLEELGAVRAKDGTGRSQYQIPTSTLSGIDDLTLGVLDAEKLLVVKTPPGAAQLIAGRIDRSSLKGVVGTIAGDDTIFVAYEKGIPVRTLRGQITMIAGSSTGKRALSKRNRTRSKGR